MRLLFAVGFSLALAGCDGTQPWNSSQASEGVCGLLWDRFKTYMEKAGRAQGSEQVYYAQIAEMNLKTLLHRDCCRFAETCPSAIQE